MWVKVDDGFPQHPKVIEAAQRLGGASGFDRVLGIWLQIMCFTNRHLTDGFISAPVANELRGTRPLEVLKVFAHPSVRLMDRVRGGWRVHDYHDYQPSAADIKDKQAWDRKRKALYSTPGLIEAIRSRDGDRCRYCGRLVNWKDRRSDAGGTYDHVIPRGANSLKNVVVACLRCNNKKSNRTPEQARMPLLPPGSETESELVPTSSLSGSDQCYPDPIRSDPDRPDPINQDQEQRGVARDARAEWKEARQNFPVLERLAHDVLDEPDTDEQTEGELCERLKDLAAKHRIAYVGEECTKAIDSARVQRRRSA